MLASDCPTSALVDVIVAKFSRASRDAPLVVKRRSEGAARELCGLCLHCNGTIDRQVGRRYIGFHAHPWFEILLGHLRRRRAWCRLIPAGHPLMRAITSALAPGLLMMAFTVSGADFAAYKQALAEGDTAAVMAHLRADGGRAPAAPHGASLLHLACSYLYAKNQAATVSALIAAGADLEARDQYGATPLNWAAGYGCAECVTLLLKAGAKVMARNLKGVTPLHVAGPKIAPLLIAAGADINGVDSNGNKPLHRQFHSAFLPVGVNVRNSQGFTPLHFAALDGNEEAVRWLLSQGADPSAASTAPYEYRDGLGAEWGREQVQLIEAGVRAYDVALWRHNATKFSTGRYRPTMELLDQATPRRAWHSR